MSAKPLPRPGRLTGRQTFLRFCPSAFGSWLLDHAQACDSSLGLLFVDRCSSLVGTCCAIMSLTCVLQGHWTYGLCFGRFCDVELFCWHFLEWSVESICDNCFVDIVQRSREVRCLWVVITQTAQRCSPGCCNKTSLVSLTIYPLCGGCLAYLDSRLWNNCCVVSVSELVITNTRSSRGFDVFMWLCTQCFAVLSQKSSCGLSRPGPCHFAHATRDRGTSRTPELCLTVIHPNKPHA